MHSLYTRKELASSLQDPGNYYVFKQGFTDDEIRTIARLAESMPGKTADVGVVDETYRRSHIKWLPRSAETEFVYSKLARYVKEANARCWQFDLVGFGEDIQFGLYDEDDRGHYDWHLDCGSQTNWRKLSVSVQLSDPSDYDGGALEFFTSRAIRRAPAEKGTCIVFPSYFLHRVTPVTRGKRLSLVVWISGPPFR